MKCLLLIPIIFLSACATRPKTYVPPDASKLKASTHRVSVAVDRVDTHAKNAAKQIDEAAKLAKEVREETRALENVPVTLLQKTVSLESKLDEARQTQTFVAEAVLEARTARDEVRREEAAYLEAAQKLADAATDERTKRIKAEKEASHLRWNSWLYRILGTVGVLLIVGLLVLWFAGKLALKL